MKRRISWRRLLSLSTIGVVCVSAQALAQTKVQVRFEDLKSLVESKNALVQAKAKELQAAAIRENSLGRSFLPSAEIFAGQELFAKGPLSARAQPVFGAEVRMNLYNGGRDQLEDQRSKLIRERKRFEGERVSAEELGKAREAYWNAIYLRELIGLLEEARKNNVENLRAAERRIRGGVATESDRVEFEMQEIDLKREREKSELERNNQLRVLRVVLGLEGDGDVELRGDLTHEHDWETSIAHTETDHAFLVKPAELHAQEAETAATARRRSWRPRIDAFAGFHQFNQREEPEFTEARDRQESVLGFRLSMNFSDQIGGNREASSLSMEANSAREEARYAHQEVEAHLHGEIAELRLLHNQVHEADENIKRAERYYRLTRSEYDRGVKNSPDMLGATEKLVAMRKKRLEIVREFQVSKSHVLSKIGR